MGSPNSRVSFSPFFLDRFYLLLNTILLCRSVFPIVVPQFLGLEGATLRGGRPGSAQIAGPEAPRSAAGPVPLSLVDRELPPAVKQLLKSQVLCESVAEALGAAKEGMPWHKWGPPEGSSRETVGAATGGECPSILWTDKKGPIVASNVVLSSRNGLHWTFNANYICIPWNDSQLFTDFFWFA